jgi:hypothetical protein
MAGIAGVVGVSAAGDAFQVQFPFAKGRCPFGIRLFMKKIDCPAICAILHLAGLPGLKGKDYTPLPATDFLWGEDHVNQESEGTVRHAP